MIGERMVSLFAAPGSFLLLTAALGVVAVLVSGLGPRAFSRVLAAVIWTGGKRGVALAVRAGRAIARGAVRLLGPRGPREPDAGEVQDASSEREDEDEEDEPPTADDGPTIHHHDRPVAAAQSTGGPSGPARKRDAEPERENEPMDPALREDFELPSTELLEPPAPAQTKVSADELKAMAERLGDTLVNYGVKGRVTDIHPGPVVTTLEMRPEKGTKVSTISRLGDDLAMSLEVKKVRIVAPIPGKNAVGFELPSPRRQTVMLSEIMGDPRFSLDRCRIPLAVGKDIIGNPYVMDLSKMPHLLIAGTTGSGKSVAINVLLMSLLFNFTPRDLRLILVDPKMVELQPYDGIPHLYLPVVTDMKHAASALRWAVDEMERRYQLFSDLNVRDIRSFNRKVDRIEEQDGAAPEAGAAGDPDPGARTRPEHLPYVVIVIDEFADLMMTSARDVEMAVSRLAAKARAAGIHLIVATQRPSVNVVTGLIKSNFPCRIAFKVASKVDSRVMLDANGAESLLGMGDMLILPPGQSELLRMHGAYVSDDEIQKLADFWRRQADPSYREEILKAGEEETGPLADEDEELDPRYTDAVAIATNEGKVSISYLQRKLKIGYNRAARIVEKMESDGIVGPSVPGKSQREVLVSPPPG
jgi:S-DNA-T family DNA segregation ATPase FtsK/SpoIIIE